MRLLGLDYGRKRVGMALSDPLGYTAQPLGFVLKDSKVFDQLIEIIQKNGVMEIVIGHPRSLSGQLGEMAKEVEAFAAELGTRTGKPVHLWDERFTTSEAEKFLISADVRRSKRKEVRDQLAAALILQGYMEHLKP